MTVETLRTPRWLFPSTALPCLTTLTIRLRVDDSYVLHAEA